VRTEAALQKHTVSKHIQYTTSKQCGFLLFSFRFGLYLLVGGCTLFAVQLIFFISLPNYVFFKKETKNTADE
jgi:hypothetical protein